MSLGATRIALAGWTRMASWTLFVLIVCGVERSALGAGCGPHRGGTRVLMDDRVKGFELLARFGALERPVHHGDETTPARPQPCQGAFCAGGPYSPAPTVPKASTDGEQWAYVTALPVVAGNAGIPLPDDESRARPSHDGLGVFHPPRVG